LCIQCGQGSTDDDGDTSTPCATCVAGFAAAAGHFGPCEACLAGRYASTAAADCTNCTAGSTDNDYDPATTCIQCLAGFYAEEGHSGECTSCPSGRFAPTAGGTALSVCEQCQSGQYSSSGSSSCAFCSSGRADEDLDGSTECTECSSGTYAGCGETSCDECVAGQEKLVTQDGEGMIIEGGIVRLYVKGVGWCSSTSADGETLMVKADPKVATNPMMPGSADTQKHGDKIEKVARGGNTRKKKNSASTTERTSNPMFVEHANPMLGSASEESASEESDPED
jgi:hypothetical protein